MSALGFSFQNLWRAAEAIITYIECRQCHRWWRRQQQRRHRRGDKTETEEREKLYMNEDKRFMWAPRFSRFSHVCGDCMSIPYHINNNNYLLLIWCASANMPNERKYLMWLIAVWLLCVLKLIARRILICRKLAFYRKIRFVFSFVPDTPPMAHFSRTTLWKCMGSLTFRSISWERCTVRK